MSWSAWDHQLFLLALALAYAPVEWRRWLWLATVFALGHSVALLLVGLRVVDAPTAAIEPIIAGSIVTMALVELAFLQLDPYRLRMGSWHAGLSLLMAGAFGVVHGMGYSLMFVSLFPFDGNLGETGALLGGFTLGVEAAQLVLLLGIWVLSYVLLEVLQWRPLFWRKLALALVAAAGLRILWTML